MSSPFEIGASGAFGLVAGLLSGFLGIGGGAILSPLLVFALGVDQHRAQGISLAALLPPVGLPAVLAYRRGGVRIDVRLVSLLIGGFIFGAFAGARLAHHLPSHELRWFFAAYLLVAAWRATQAKDRAESEGAAAAGRRAWLGVPIGVVAGTMSGLLGVGGGIVALPLLRRFAGLSRLEAQATTLAMMLPPIGLPAVYVYASEQGGLPWELLVVVGLGFAVGAGLGARLAGRVNTRMANATYATLLVVLALLLVLRP